MRSTVWEGVGRIGLVEVEEPVPGPDDVVLDVAACGICGSDVHAFAEGAWITPGAPMGHEFSGTVAAVGVGVRDLKVGDRVAVNPMGPCGSCRQCALGRTNLCAAPVHSARGGLSDKVLVPNAESGARLHRMPDSMAFEEGAFLEPLSVATRAVTSAAPELDGPAVVSGLGSIGQCVLRVLLAHGARDVVGIDVSPARLAAASGLGAEVVDARADDPRAYLLDRWGTSTSPYQVGGNVGTFFECSGAPPMITLATEVVRAGGTVSVAGLVGASPPVDLDTVVQKELRLLGSFAYTGPDATEAFRLLADGLVDVTPLVSHRIPLSRVAEAFDRQHAVDGSVKVLVVPDPQES
ncbi:alcohol dehydrogenase catalytic domain-containing protein [Pseudonocardia sp. RS11V-5]|uniref:zinc-dependent alcohol dehydrogenase n=1 Tax=Pseudonocardia terrae TaxID=2905831 RepID=UPI001E3E3D8E|nr:alcohol dehydrogenase catalytic domain-containing protein [Pseudonocardia terrae]MCE3553657.1 alcohol dehydrogenase catalytic domain-containing protein [Pseudonocardia terrae]